MNLYQMIYKRRSIRKFKKETVPEQLLKDILYFGDCVSRLYPDIKTKIVINENPSGRNQVRSLRNMYAPYYLTFYSEDREGNVENAGYILEPILLYMTGKGLGTCYLGQTKLLKTNSVGMIPIITVAFGYPKNLLYRDPSTAKRLSLKELCVFKEEIDESMKNILKAVRLAPSVMNIQPWRFIVYHDKIYIFACREFLPSNFIKNLRKMSIGIMLSHLVIASEEMWMSIKLEAEEVMKKKSYKSGLYVATAFLKEYKC